MVRQIIQIDEEKCNGCGACVTACHEGAIGMVNGKAKLLRDDYCDGLGDCLPACPVDAITFVQRKAAPFDEAAVEANKLKKSNPSACSCPGTAVKSIKRGEDVPEVNNKEKSNPLPCGCPGTNSKTIKRGEDVEKTDYQTQAQPSELSQWPVQIKLVPVNAPYFEGAKLLVAADCSAFAYGSFHERFIKGRIVLIGCPKLDSVDYSEKLTAIIANNNIASVTAVRMEVPCCGGIEHAVKNALRNSGKIIPWQIVTISTDGKIIEEV